MMKELIVGLKIRFYLAIKLTTFLENFGKIYSKIKHYSYKVYYIWISFIWLRSLKIYNLLRIVLLINLSLLKHIIYLITGADKMGSCLSQGLYSES